MSSTSHRRRRFIVTAVVLLALAGGATAAILLRKPKAAPTTAAASIFKTATVKRGDLTTIESVDGSVQLPSTLTVLHRIEGQSSSSSTPAASVTTQPTASSRANPAATSNVRVTQTVTSIIATNAAIRQGSVLYTVDGAPVIALDGALPAWRSLSTASADGADITQLEASLVALGYDPNHKVTVDDHFDSATRTMVKAWQQGLGVATTGKVALGSVVFLPAATTVSAVDRVVGDTVGEGDTMLTVTSSVQEVLIDVPAGDEARVVPGLAVDIGNVQGAVSRLRSANRSGSVVVEAVITPAAPIDNATNGSSVKVKFTLQDQAGVLIVPAEALVSRLDGTYAVQPQAAGGTTKWLTVELLGVSGGNAAIRGTELTEGMVLLLPV